MTTTAHAPAPPVAADNGFRFLDDYCARCCLAGIAADSRDRLAALTEPDGVTWTGGRRVICHYRCSCCGHTWTSRLWTAREAGFDPRQHRSTRNNGAAA